MIANVMIEGGIYIFAQSDQNRRLIGAGLTCTASLITCFSTFSFFYFVVFHGFF